VNLIIHDPPIIKKNVSARAVRDLLRNRVGEEVRVTDGRTSIFLYAATADAAETAERAAHEVLAGKACSGTSGSSGGTWPARPGWTCGLSCLLMRT